MWISATFFSFQTRPFFSGMQTANSWIVSGMTKPCDLDFQDQLIGEDKLKYKLKGGCTALVALFILGKVYVSNSGDSRAVLVRNKKAIPMSNDHTPETEKPRIRYLVSLRDGVTNIITEPACSEWK